MIAIELDDKTHNSIKRTERDEFLDKALENAGLKILRIRTDYSYKPNELKERIEKLLMNK